MSAAGAPETIMTFCKKCGAQLRAPAALAGKHGKCAQCGASIRIPLKSDPAPAAAAAAAPAQNAPAAEKPQQKSMNMVLAGGVAAVVGVALALGIYALFFMGSSDSRLPPTPLPQVAAPDSAPGPQASGPSVPSVINLTPKNPEPGRQPPSGRPAYTPRPAPAPEPSPGRSFRPGHDAGPGMNPGPSPGMGPGMSPGMGPRPGSGMSPQPGGDMSRRMGSRSGSSRSIEVWDGIRQGLVSLTVTVNVDKTATLTAKREIQAPFVVVIRKGVRPFAASASAQVAVQVDHDVVMDFQGLPEVSVTLPLAGPSAPKTFTIAAEKRPSSPALPAQP